MVADSIESATRVLQEPTPERVRDLVDGIIESKRQDGQLDEAPLTMREIGVLKDTFVTVLSGIYHHRIDYPTTKHLTDAPDETSKRVSASERKTIAPAPVSSVASDGEAGADGEAAVSGEAGASEQMELGDDERLS